MSEIKGASDMQDIFDNDSSEANETDVKEKDLPKLPNSNEDKQELKAVQIQPKVYDSKESLDKPDLNSMCDTPDVSSDKDLPFQPDTNVYDDILKKAGLISETANDETSEGTTDTNDGSKDHSDYLEKGDDGKYYDKETGKSYDSVEQWEKEQETLAKRYEGTAKYYEDKAKKEWARFKNAEQNGESDAEKWEHYRKSQEYYAKAKECKEKAKHIREKLGQSNNDAQSDLNQNEATLTASFDAVPTERKEVVKTAFENAPDAIKDVANKLESLLRVKDAEPNTMCRYSPSENVIYMNPNYDNDEYSEVFVHEFGHFADIQLGSPSSEFDFVFAMDEDVEKLNSDDIKGKMLDELADSDAIFDRSVSDILSGAFMNDYDIMKKYQDEGAAYYSHPNEYWVNGPINAREKETFANLFRIYSNPDGADSKAFVEKYFPNTCEAFKNSLSI